MDSPTVKIQTYQDGARGPDSYRGLSIHALKGLHNRLGELLKRSCPDRTRVLDLGAGSGAMTQRMIDLGHHVTAVDYVGSQFRILEGDPVFKEADLNGNFSELGEGRERFSVIVAVEIIEHLENPRHFLRELRKLLKDDGIAFLTTPNIDSSYSVAHFLSTGCFSMFDDSSYESSGHITPISFWQLNHMLEEAGFEMVHHEVFGDDSMSFRSWPLFKVAWFLMRFMRRRRAFKLEGCVHICMVRASH